METSAIVVLLAQGLGAGLSPWAPGTVASALFMLLWWPLARLSRTGYTVAWALVVLAGWVLCDVAARALAVHDAPSIVWDELGGLLLALVVVPRRLPWALAGLAAFRFFDVLKPWPVGWVDENIGGGLGIMMDDLVAALFALALLLAARGCCRRG